MRVCGVRRLQVLPFPGVIIDRSGLISVASPYFGRVDTIAMTNANTAVSTILFKF